MSNSSEGGAPPSNSSQVQDQLDQAVARTEGLQPGRRIFHALTGLTVVAVLQWLVPDPERARWLFGGLLATLLVLDVIRLSSPRLNLTLFRLFRWVASPREHDRIASSTWYVVGVFLLVMLFPQGTWVPSVLVLALGDPSASYVGRRWGQRKLGGGTVAGSLAFFTVTTLVLYFFCPLPKALAVAASVGAVEALPRFVVDDNVTIPVATAVFLWLFQCV